MSEYPVTKEEHLLAAIITKLSPEERKEVLSFDPNRKNYVAVEHEIVERETEGKPKTTAGGEPIYKLVSGAEIRDAYAIFMVTKHKLNKKGKNKAGEVIFDTAIDNLLDEAITNYPTFDKHLESSTVENIQTMQMPKTYITDHMYLYKKLAADPTKVKELENFKKDIDGKATAADARKLALDAVKTQKMIETGKKIKEEEAKKKGTKKASIDPVTDKLLAMEEAINIGAQLSQTFAITSGSQSLPAKSAPTTGRTGGGMAA
jgi:hypothetical protein